MAGIFIPDCENEVCVEGRRRLVEASRTLGHVVAPNQIGGLFANTYRQQFDSCRCVVLHKCPKFYNKLKRHSLDQYMLNDANKLYCVHYGNTAEGGAPEFEEFFDNFTICPATNDNNIAEFLNNFLFNSAHSRDVDQNTVSAASSVGQVVHSAMTTPPISVGHGVHLAMTPPPISVGHGVHPAMTPSPTQNPNNPLRLLTDGGAQILTQTLNSPPALNKDDSADNKGQHNQSLDRPISQTQSQRFFKQISQKSSDGRRNSGLLRQSSERRERIVLQNFAELSLAHQNLCFETDSSLVKFVGHNVNKNKTRVSLAAVRHQNSKIINTTNTTSLSDLADLIKDLETNEESLKVNVMFFVQSMLPEFSQHCSTDCIALIAANTGNVLIQSRALDTLELLLFKGRITQHKVDIDMLGTVQQATSKRETRMFNS